MHRHYCDAEGHDWQCGEDCECICGLPMEGNDHSECPVELRACAQHAVQSSSSAEIAPGAVDIDFSILSPERQQFLLHCNCGCTDTTAASVGFCLWCDHAYADYSPEIEARHFVDHCPGAPEALRRFESDWLAQRQGRNSANRGSRRKK